MIKKTLATTAFITLLSTSAFAIPFLGGDTINNTDNSTNQGQGQVGINSLENDILSKNKNINNNDSSANALGLGLGFADSDSKSEVKNSGNSKSESGVYGSGNSDNLNAQIDASYTSNKQKTDASSSNDISVTGDVYNEAKNNANTAIAPIALSNWTCSMGGSLAVQGDQFGASAGGSNESTDCVANKNALVVATLFPNDKDLQKSELCTGKQHREAFEARGIDADYCKPKSTWLGLKPIASGVKELVLSPFKLIGSIFGV